MSSNVKKSEDLDGHLMTFSSRNFLTGAALRRGAQISSFDSIPSLIP